MAIDSASKRASVASLRGRRVYMWPGVIDATWRARLANVFGTAFAGTAPVSAVYRTVTMRIGDTDGPRSMRGRLVIGL